MRGYGRYPAVRWQQLRHLSDAARLLDNYLHSCPHSNAIGAYALPAGYIAEDLRWTEAAVEQALRELVDDGVVVRFADGRHIAIVGFLDPQRNPIQNGNVLKAALGQLDLLPDDEALSAVIEDLKPYAEQFKDKVPTALDALSKRLAKPFRIPEPLPNLTKAESESATAAEAFERFFAAFPKKAGKTQAASAFKKALERGTADRIIAGAERYAAEQKDTDQQFVKSAASWLAKECWRDYEDAISVLVPETWNDAAPALLAEIGMAAFGSYFAKTELDVGPPVSIRARSEFLADHITKNFAKPLAKIFGNNVRVIAA